jgi:hypothetical protein
MAASLTSPSIETVSHDEASLALLPAVTEKPRPYQQSQRVR